MPNVIASRSIANEPSSAWLRRTNPSPSPIERRTRWGSSASGRPSGGWGAIAAAVTTLARQLTASGGDPGPPPRGGAPHREAAARVGGVRRADAGHADQQAAEPRADDVRELVEPEVQR